MSAWSDSELIGLFERATPLIDVRAPIEYSHGAIPFSVNLPVLSDEERTLVGTCYKVAGQARAIELGHELVREANKERKVQAWREFLGAHPEAQLFCFRGGLRSQISCQWLRDEGVEIFPLTGGYKRLRNFFIAWLEEAPLPSIVRVGGLTGSGKTQVLSQFPNCLDLEEFAHHRGSAFGARGPQPAQITFENRVALRCLELRNRSQMILEDESAVIGGLSVPRRLFSLMRDSPLVILLASEEERVRHIFEEYVREDNQIFFLSGLEKIRPRLQGNSYRDIHAQIHRAWSLGPTLNAHYPWISLLLRRYYDPIYQRGVERQREKVVFTGTVREVQAYLDDLRGQA